MVTLAIVTSLSYKVCVSDKGTSSLLEQRKQNLFKSVSAGVGEGMGRGEGSEQPDTHHDITPSNLLNEMEQLC